MNIREVLLKNQFPEELTEAVLKSAKGLTAAQFCNMYKFLMAEKTSITKAYMDSFEAEAIEPIDYTRAILEAKYGKK